MEPVSGIEPLTCRLQEARPDAVSALPARMVRVIARIALVALEFSDATFHEPFHAHDSQRVYGGNQPWRPEPISLAP